MKKYYNKNILFVAMFALLNLIMYFTLNRFWIGGSSFLPMIGKLGPKQGFLFAFIVNLGVIAGAFIGAKTSNEFNLKIPPRHSIFKAILGGMLIGIGITLAPGTCTTAFVIGLPMLSISSFISMAGIFIGAFIMYQSSMRSCLNHK